MALKIPTYPGALVVQIVVQRSCRRVALETVHQVLRLCHVVVELLAVGRRLSGALHPSFGRQHEVAPSRSIAIQTKARSADRARTEKVERLRFDQVFCIRVAEVNLRTMGSYR